MTICNTTSQAFYLWIAPLRTGIAEPDITFGDIQNNPLAKWVLVPPTGSQASTRLQGYCTTTKLFGQRISEDVNQSTTEMNSDNPDATAERIATYSWQWVSGIYSPLAINFEEGVVAPIYTAIINHYCVFLDKKNDPIDDA